MLGWRAGFWEGARSRDLVPGPLPSLGSKHGLLGTILRVSVVTPVPFLRNEQINKTTWHSSKMQTDGHDVGMSKNAHVEHDLICFLFLTCDNIFYKILQTFYDVLKRLKYHKICMFKLHNLIVICRKKKKKIKNQRSRTFLFFLYSHSYSLNIFIFTTHSQIKSLEIW